MKKDNKSYDFAKKNRAGVSASLRGMVALYLVYTAWNLIKTASDPSSTLPIWGAWLAAAFFATVAVLFGLYAWRRYQQELSEAVLSDEDLAEMQTDVASLEDLPPEDEEELPQ